MHAVREIPLYKAIWRDAWSEQPALFLGSLVLLFCSLGLLIFADCVVVMLAWESGGIDKLVWVAFFVAMQCFIVGLLVKWLTEKVSWLDDYPESDEMTGVEEE